MEDATELKIICMNDIQRQNIEWLWYPYIPYGKLTIIQGDPGEGKTTFVLNLASRLTKGIGFDGNELKEEVSIIYQTAEDGLADTVKPRLEEANADCTRILVIDDSVKSLSMADTRLEKAIEQTKAKVLILDPIQAYLGDGVDMNRANETRDMTKCLGALADRTGCAVILIGHMNKSGGSKAAYRGIGSIDFFAVARSVLLVARVAEQPNIRVVAQIKNNLAEEGSPVAFELSNGKFIWIGDYEITVDELLGGYIKGNKQKQAEQLVKSLAEVNDRLPSKEIYEKAEQQGISQRTMKTVKKKLHIKPIKVGSEWGWDLHTLR